MNNVANQSSAVTTITSFLRKLYKPVVEWANEKFATKDELKTATGVSITIMTEDDAHSIWKDYKFETTD